jgi:hypothetical protein
VADLALTCDQLRHDFGLNRILPIPSGPVLLARVWHVRKGFIGIQATPLDEDLERGRRHTEGACQGGAVWFGIVTPDQELVVGEGIETTLSAMILLKAKCGAATLGTEGLKALVLPQAARNVVIAADNDPVPPGKKIGHGVGAAKAAKRLWLSRDPRINVRLAIPHLKDYNDELMESRHG